MFLFPFIILCRWVRRHDFSEKERDEVLCYHSTDYRVILKPILKSNFKFKILSGIVQIKLTPEEEEDRNVTLPIGSCYCIVRQTMYFCDSPRWTAAVLFNVSVLGYFLSVLNVTKYNKSALQCISYFWYTSNSRERLTWSHNKTLHYLFHSVVDDFWS